MTGNLTMARKSKGKNISKMPGLIKKLELSTDGSIGKNAPSVEVPSGPTKWSFLMISRKLLVAKSRFIILMEARMNSYLVLT
jgi:hypothetical protein